MCHTPWHFRYFNGVFLDTKKKFLKEVYRGGGNPFRRRLGAGVGGEMGEKTLFSTAQIPKEKDGEK